jgi:hypothetical protein
LYEELEALERRVNMQLGISNRSSWKQVEEHTSLGSKLEEVGVEPTQEEMTEANLSEEEAEQQLNDETAELESAAGWKANSIGEENNMGDQDDLPIDKEEVQQEKTA